MHEQFLWFLVWIPFRSRKTRFVTSIAAFDRHSLIELATQKLGRNWGTIRRTGGRAMKGRVTLIERKK